MNYTFICYNAGCDIWEIEKYNPSIEWHNQEFRGTYSECVMEKALQEREANLFTNLVPLYDGF